jgi:hypothetical protein
MPTQTTKKKAGAPPGHVGNPTGKNQWEGVRSDRPIGVRLLKELDEKLREYSKSQGITMTELIEQAIAEKLAHLESELNRSQGN